MAAIHTQSPAYKLLQLYTSGIVKGHGGMSCAECNNSKAKGKQRAMHLWLVTMLNKLIIEFIHFSFK